MTAMHTDLIDVSGSCAHAKDAFPAWAKTPPAERGSVLLAAAEVLAEHAEELAELNQRETGKLRADSVGGVEAGIGTLRQYAELGPLHQGERLQGAIEAIDYSLPEPRGLVAVITPWNDPVAIACGLIGAALVTGNVVVHKPSERCPQLGERLGELLEPAFPTGVFTTLSGPGETGADLVANPEVDMIAHVGSTATGRRIARAAALTGAHVILENGGNDALIVDAGVDPVWAAQQAALGCFANGGQICTSVERIFVHEQVAEAFTEALLAEAEQWMQTGRLAPLVDERMRTEVHEQVTESARLGAQILLGGTIPDGEGTPYPATVVTGCTPSMPLFTEETFGPVAAIARSGSFEEALQAAAAGDHGLAATVLTESIAHANQAAARLPVGTVKINAVFGGAPGGSAEPRRLSGTGFGYGPRLLDEMTQLKVVHLSEPGGEES